MERILKFRVWNQREMADIQWHASFDKSGQVNVMYGCYIMQFTGFYDVNKKEVYESDIILVNGKNHEIKYEDGIFGVRISTVFASLNYMFRTYGRIEVVGNIYQNRSLLKNN